MVDFGYLVNIAHPPGSDLQRVIRDQGMLISECRDLGFSTIGFSEHRSVGGEIYLPTIPLISRLVPYGEGLVFAATVLIAAFHHPILLAEQSAYLDAITGGRFALGLGVGWGDAQFAPLSFPSTRRAEILEETVAILRSLWASEGPTSFKGRHYSLDNVDVTLRPVQAEGPPIWIGASVPTAVRRAARIGDAWIGSAHLPAVGLHALWEEYQQEIQAVGHALPKVQPRIRSVFVGESHEHAVRLAGEQMTREYRSLGNSGLFQVIGESHSNVDIGTVGARAIIGSAEEVAEALTAFIRTSGASLVLVRSQTSGIDAVSTARSLNLFAEKVAPAVRSELDLGSATG